MTLARAYELFLTTYYDPFSPELYMYQPQSAYAASTSFTGGVLGKTAVFFRKLWETLVQPSHAVMWGTS
ncbi:hypothetical protein BDZ89DRAFT_1061330 [Hymenopellis radicata]|nr:hypothetical protein BDZ89DRAFT_1061330 [Hymenopellis radicata]